MAASLPASYHDCRLISRPLGIATPDGVIPVEKIGKGTFSTVYREIDGARRVFSVVAENVSDEEIAQMAHGSDPNNPHLPRVDRIGTLTDGRSIYEMPFYHTPFRAARANTASRAAYSALQKCINSVMPEYRVGREERGYNIALRKIECIEMTSAKIPIRLVDAVRGLFENSTNYSDQYDFEFSPRNTATDDEGNLVLLDVICDRDQLFGRRGRR